MLLFIDKVYLLKIKYECRYYAFDCCESSRNVNHEIWNTTININFIYAWVNTSVFRMIFLYKMHEEIMSIILYYI